MTEQKKQYDNEPGFDVSSRFSEDLGAVFGPQGHVPTHVDRAVAEAARRHFGARPRRLWWLRWAVPTTAAAAALVALAVYLPTRRAPAPQAANSVTTRTTRVDIDGNGRVDILDAFQLARHIESAGPTNESWDINGDGLVNRDDVDKVALAAVRLSKGV